MMTLQKLLCSSFQLLRSSTPTIWFWEAGKKKIQEIHGKTYVNAQQVLHPLKDGKYGVLDDGDNILRRVRHIRCDRLVRRRPKVGLISCAA